MALRSSGYTVTEPIQINNFGYWVFVAPSNPDIRIANIKVQQPLQQNIAESFGSFKPLGSSKTIVVATSIYGVDGTYEFTIEGTAQWDSFYPVLTYQGVLLSIDPLGRQKYVRFVDRNWNELGNINNLIRQVKVTYYEVDAP